VRVLVALVDVQLGDDRAAEAVVGNHSLDGTFDNEFGMATAAGLGRLGLVATDETGVAHVLLLDFLLAGKDGLFGIDDNDVIAGIDVGGENGLVLAPEEDGGFFSHTTDDLVIGINNVPLAFDLFCFGAKSFHREPEIKPRRTSHVKEFLSFIMIPAIFRFLIRAGK